MDDLIIPGYNEEDAFRKLLETLSVAADKGLSINWKKCKFLQRRVEFLGHVIEGGCIKSSPAKVDAVQKFLEPKSLRQLRSFFGTHKLF